MKRIITIAVVSVVVLGLLALLAPAPAVAGPGGNRPCKIIFDPPPGFTCGPCEMLVACCKNFKRCGCVKVPGCKP